MHIVSPVDFFLDSVLFQTLLVIFSTLVTTDTSRQEFTILHVDKITIC